uniref:Uncharacterized protein n=1 Tax=Daphnia galeata TaxID=27404 RepID=A0A8J2WP12_9CRUS|nr:unnamed protein product [Daphnia galeata]
MGNSQILEIATANNVSLKQKTDQQQQEKMITHSCLFQLFQQSEQEIPSQHSLKNDASSCSSPLRGIR